MTNLIRTTLCSTVLVLFAAAQPIHALTPEFSSSAPVVVVVDDDAYTAGTRAMDEHRWPDAVSAFDKVISEKGKRVDAALYWKAYSLNKLGKTPLAIATCDQLHSQFAGQHVEQGLRCYFGGCTGRCKDHGRRQGKGKNGSGFTRT